MARNSEKAMTALSRWRQLQLGEEKDKRDERRPYNPQECNDLQKALKFRRQVVSEISKKIATIQNPGLGEFKLRDLNDEINKQLREKTRWEYRIRELGGPDYLKSGMKLDGRELPGHRGYKYFGAAKDLPGVRELFEPPPSSSTQKQTRAELMRRIDARYFGFLDDELIDESVEQKLAEAEKQVIEKRNAEWRVKNAAFTASINAKRSRVETGFEYGGTLNQVKSKAPKQNTDAESVTASASSNRKEVSEDDKEKEKQEFASLLHESATESGAMMVVSVPSQKEVEEAIVRRKKIELLDRYCTDALISDEQNTRSMLGL